MRCTKLQLVGLVRVVIYRTRSRGNRVDALPRRNNRRIYQHRVANGRVNHRGINQDGVTNRAIAAGISSVGISGAGRLLRNVAKVAIVTVVIQGATGRASILGKARLRWRAVAAAGGVVQRFSNCRFCRHNTPSQSGDSQGGNPGQNSSRSQSRMGDRRHRRERAKHQHNLARKGSGLQRATLTIRRFLGKKVPPSFPRIREVQPEIVTGNPDQQPVVDNGTISSRERLS